MNLPLKRHSSAFYTDLNLWFSPQKREKNYNFLPLEAKLALGLHPQRHDNEKDHDMTYCYTRKDVKTTNFIMQIKDAGKLLSGKIMNLKADKDSSKAQVTKAQVAKAKTAKTSKLKVIAISAAVAAMTAFIVMPKTNTSAQVTPQFGAASSVQLAGAPKLELRTKTPLQKISSVQVPEALTYKGLDSAIRNVQIDNAHLGHSLKMAMVSDRNPIKVFFIWLERVFSLPALLVGFSFLFTMLMLGFIRPAGEDLSNY